MIDCKWCGRVGAETVFEAANLCQECHQKATWAAQNPALCTKCHSLFTTRDALEALLSEEGFPHGGWGPSAEKGCPLCRMFLLQDPNPDMNRNQSGASIFAETKGGDGNDAADIVSLYFWSLRDHFKLTLSVSAVAGEDLNLSLSCWLTIRR
jgi:hypothetical protein